MARCTSFSEARDLMKRFADRTGLSPRSTTPVRYLWTDAFAVCNYCELYRQTGSADFLHLAVALIDQVHAVLGKYREDDPRQGWISGLSDDQARQHPTAAGLRIGKALQERVASEPFDKKLEWDRDGQYFHYLTKWMHALHQMSRMTGDAVYLRWAIELARAAHAGFTHGAAGVGCRRMYWKMSVDLSRPLVPSMGLHDPLDALVTYLELRAATEARPNVTPLSELRVEVNEAAAMCAGKDWTTIDPLGLGGLLFDAYRLVQLGTKTINREQLLELLLVAACQGLDAFVRANPLSNPVQYRLAFRELGLSIGLQAARRIGYLLQRDEDCSLDSQRLRSHLEYLRQFYPLSDGIEVFWRRLHNWGTESWIAHNDINTVMLATSLIPDGFLSLSQAAPGLSEPCAKATSHYGGLLK